MLSIAVARQWIDPKSDSADPRGNGEVTLRIEKRRLCPGKHGNGFGQRSMDSKGSEKHSGGKVKYRGGIALMHYAERQQGMDRARIATALHRNG